MELVERCIEGHLGLLVGVVVVVVIVVVVLLLLTDVPSGGFASLLANEMGIKQLETQVIIRGAHSWVLSCSESSIYRQVSINWEW